MPDPAASSESESGTPLVSRRAALRRGLLLGLGVATVVGVSGCAGGGDEDEDEDD